MNKTIPSNQPIYDINQAIQPILEIADTNRQAFDTLTELQTEYLTQGLEAGFQQLQNLISFATDPQALATAQLDYFKKLENTIVKTSEQEFQAIHQAHDKVNKILSDSYNHQGKFINGLFPLPNNPTLS